MELLSWVYVGGILIIIFVIRRFLLKLETELKDYPQRLEFVEKKEHEILSGEGYTPTIVKEEILLESN